MDIKNYITPSQFARALKVSRQSVYQLAQHVRLDEVAGRLAISRHVAVAYCSARIQQHELAIAQLRSAIAEIMSADINEDEDDSTKTDF